MKGDFYRYLLDCKNENITQQDYINKIYQCYSEAEDTAKNLDVIDITRIGLLLNFAVFYYENLLEPGKAILMLRQTLNESLNALSRVKSEDFKEVSTLFQFMRDNLTLWTNDSNDKFKKNETNKN